MKARVLPSTVSLRSQPETFPTPRYYTVMPTFIIKLKLAVKTQPQSQTTVSMLSHASSSFEYFPLVQGAPPVPGSAVPVKVYPDAGLEPSTTD